VWAGVTRFSPLIIIIYPVRHSPYAIKQTAHATIFMNDVLFQGWNAFPYKSPCGIYRNDRVLADEIKITTYKKSHSLSITPTYNVGMSRFDFMNAIYSSSCTSKVRFRRRGPCFRVWNIFVKPTRRSPAHSSHCDINFYPLENNKLLLVI